MCTHTNLWEQGEVTSKCSRILHLPYCLFVTAATLCSYYITVRTGQGSRAEMQWDNCSSYWNSEILLFQWANDLRMSLLPHMLRVFSSNQQLKAEGEASRHVPALWTRSILYTLDPCTVSGFGAPPPPCHCLLLIWSLINTISSGLTPILCLVCVLTKKGTGEKKIFRKL